MTSSTAAEALEPSVFDAGWLRAVLRHALRCSLASSLALTACAGGADAAGRADPISAPVDAGDPALGDSALGDSGAMLRTRLEATCDETAVWRLAAGFQPARKVDYIADRVDPTSGGVLSEYGEPCASAIDKPSCESALELPTTIGRHLATTEGDAVRLWTYPAALTLFGDIDTPEEAIWLLLMNGYNVACNAKVGYAAGQFSVEADRVDGCTDRLFATVLVSAQGQTEETATRTTSTGQGCVSEGRRPEGLRSTYRPRGFAVLGEHFAAMAHMEAASVPAFAAIARELRSYAAPAALVRGAERALLDEVRHARVTAQLARRFGARAVAPRVARTALRSLEAFALDNAVEGCVNETYAAAAAAYRAARAGDRVIRRALAGIAADETRHAELSWAIARWVMPQLDRGARARVRAAQDAAVLALAASLRADVDAELCARAGVPDARAACALHAVLARSLWQA